MLIAIGTRYSLILCIMCVCAPTSETNKLNYQNYLLLATS